MEKAEFLSVVWTFSGTEKLQGNCQLVSVLCFSLCLNVANLKPLRKHMANLNIFSLQAFADEVGFIIVLQITSALPLN